MKHTIAILALFTLATSCNKSDNSDRQNQAKKIKKVIIRTTAQDSTMLEFFYDNSGKLSKIEKEDELGITISFDSIRRNPSGKINQILKFGVGLSSPSVIYNFSLNSLGQYTSMVPNFLGQGPGDSLAYEYVGSNLVSFRIYPTNQIPPFYIDTVSYTYDNSGEPISIKHTRSNGYRNIYQLRFDTQNNPFYFEQDRASNVIINNLISPEYTLNSMIQFTSQSFSKFNLIQMSYNSGGKNIYLSHQYNADGYPKSSIIDEPPASPLSPRYIYFITYIYY